MALTSFKVFCKRDEINIGFQSIANESSQTKTVLSSSHLNDFVDSLPNGINKSVGYGGTRNSVGKTQRLGIAIALSTSPRLLVLHEATNALKRITEADVSNSVN